MIKGAQKQMIVVRTGTSRYFDEAYFVLKSGLKPKREEQTDLLTEANRIIKESEELRTGKKSNRPWLWFAIGLLIGAVLTAAVAFLF